MKGPIAINTLLNVIWITANQLVAQVVMHFPST